MTYPNPTGVPVPPPPPPKKKANPLWIVLAVVGGVIAVCVFGSVLVAIGSGDDPGVAASDRPVSTRDATASSDGASERASESPSRTEPAGPKTEFGDGQWLVGRDVKPGTYRTTGPADDGIGTCYWAREKDASGEFDAIIANGDPTGPANVTVNKGEYFETNGCQTWRLAG